MRHWADEEREPERSAVAKAWRLTLAGKEGLAEAERGKGETGGSWLDPDPDCFVLGACRNTL